MEIYPLNRRVVEELEEVEKSLVHLEEKIYNTSFQIGKDVGPNDEDPEDTFRTYETLVAGVLASIRKLNIEAGEGLLASSGGDVRLLPAVRYSYERLLHRVVAYEKRVRELLSYVDFVKRFLLY